MSAAAVIVNVANYSAACMHKRSTILALTQTVDLPLPRRASDVFLSLIRAANIMAGKRLACRCDLAASQELYQLLTLCHTLGGSAGTKSRLSATPAITSPFIHMREVAGDGAGREPDRRR